MTGTRYPDFKWSFSTLGCPELSLEETCKLAAEFGIRNLEARVFEDELDLPKYFQEKFGSPEKVLTILAEHEVSISCLDTSLKLIGNDEESRAAFLKFLPWAEGLNVKWLRVFDGGEVKHDLDENSLAQAMETFDWWKTIRNNNGWQTNIAIETHDALSSLEACQTLISNAFDKVNLIWDTHHTWKKGEEAVQPVWEELKAYIRNAHIKDSVSKPSARHPYTYTQLGEGEFPLEEALELLSNDGYNGYVTIEWEKKWHPYLDELRTVLEKARDLGWI